MVAFDIDPLNKSLPPQISPQALSGQRQQEAPTKIPLARQTLSRMEQNLVVTLGFLHFQKGVDAGPSLAVCWSRGLVTLIQTCGRHLGSYKSTASGMWSLMVLCLLTGPLGIPFISSATVTSPRRLSLGLTSRSSLVTHPCLFQFNFIRLWDNGFLGNDPKKEMTVFWLRYVGAS